MYAQRRFSGTEEEIVEIGRHSSPRLQRMDFQNTEKKLPKTSYNDRLFARFETKTSGMTVELKEIEEFLVY